MGQGPVLLPPRLPQPSGQLPQTPLRQTNPVLANLQDFLLSALGITDGLGPDASNAAILGVGASALLPILGTVRKAKTAEQAIAAAEQRIQGIKAYHGSPHDFDQFSLSKIGTGEGAQAYGHGLYFAENPNVAKEYREKLADGMVELYGQKYPVPSWRGDMDPHTRLIRRLADVRTGRVDVTDAEVVDSVRKKIQYELGNKYGDKASLQKELELLDRAQQHPAGIKTEAGGRTYEVSLNASPDDFLDWDKPLSQQSEKVRGVIDKVLKEHGGSERYRLEKFGDNPDGNSLYRNLTTGGGDFEKKLKDAGIKGIRYLDQGSRPHMEDVQHGVQRVQQKLDRLKASNAHPDLISDAEQELQSAKRGVGDLTSNYVVFDDAIIDIMKKYGVALPIAAAGLKAQQERSQRGQAHAAF